MGPVLNKLDARRDLRNAMKTLLLILFCAFPLFAEDLWVTQSGAGAANGSSEANAWSLASFNTSGNWGSGDNKISAGDIVFLSGTFTSRATLLGSGSLGSSISIIFTNSGRFSAAHWNTSAGQNITTDNALYGNGVSYINLIGDRNQNGLFECTANGTLLANQKYSVGVMLHDSAFIYATGLRFTNIYVRVKGGDNSDGVLNGGIQFRSGGGNSITVSNCYFSHLNTGVYLGYAGADTNITLVDCVGSDGLGEGAIVIGGESGTVSNVVIRGWDFSGSEAWGGYVDIHGNHIHAYATVVGHGLLDLSISKNYFHGNMGSNQTSFCYVEGAAYESKVFNNLFFLENTGAGNGLLFFNSAARARIYNNTFLSTNGYNGVTASDQGQQNGGYLLTNNFFHSTSHGVYDPNGWFTNCNYNVYFANTYWGNFDSWANWQAAGKDVNGSTNMPTFSSGLVPGAADTVLRNAAVSIGIVPDDKRGVVRPQETFPDVGAFEFNPLVPFTARSSRLKNINGL